MTKYEFFAETNFREFGKKLRNFVSQKFLLLK